VKSQDLTALWQVDRYGDFRLTGAVRPARGAAVVPREGFRFDVFRDADVGVRVPLLVAAVSRERLFDVFLDLLAPLGPTVDVVLETSHEARASGHRDLFREHIDLPVLMSYFCDFEDLLLNDGCTGVAVIATTAPMEVQFDEHKLLVVYARDLEPAEQILRQHGVPCDDSLKLITEAEHLHGTDPHQRDAFEQLCCRVGVGEPAERVNWW
jgi:hypothetical protein